MITYPNLFRIGATSLVCFTFYKGLFRQDSGLSCILQILKTLCLDVLIVGLFRAQIEMIISH